jgi:hypothetical protein
MVFIRSKKGVEPNAMFQLADTVVKVVFHDAGVLHGVICGAQYITRSILCEK